MARTRTLNTLDGRDVFGAAAARITTAVAAIRTRWEHRRRIDALYTELAAHNDRALADLGFERHDLPRIAREAAGAR